MRINFSPICCANRSLQDSLPRLAFQQSIHDQNRKLSKALNCSIIKSLTPYQSLAFYYFVNGEDFSVSLVTDQGKSLRAAPLVTKQLGSRNPVK